MKGFMMKAKELDKPFDSAEDISEYLVISTLIKSYEITVSFRLSAELID